MRRSAETELALECCRPNFHGIPGDLPARVDWGRFLHLVEFHRIWGLSHRALRDASSVPRGVSEKLARAALDTAANNLLAASESRSLLVLFEAAKVPVLFVKGLTLGTLAYGNPSFKSAIDIDLLIDPSDLDRAIKCLGEAGFEPIAPQGSLKRWHRSWKESVWRSRSSRMQLDLHTRLADNPRLIPTIDVHSATQMVDVGSGIALPTFANDELLTYLAVHGAASGWFRLKWIADFAALLSRVTGDDFSQLYDRSLVLGGGRAVGQAILLSDELFGSLGKAPEFRRRLRADAATCRLLSLALTMIDRAPCEPTERFLGTLPIHLSQFGIESGAGYKLAEFRRQAAQLMTRLTV